ncbi:MAG: RNA polymerase subunit sigma-70 [Microbacteriaceae bacterium]|nr:MAG: RNA polymerase subunit sigma-70 [Microbacteriaceae bacterium]
MSDQEVRATAERVARTSYGRLVAILAAATGDLESAEDAVSVAFERALTAWPRAGIPDNPEGWLVTVAHNHQRDLWKSSAHRTAAPFDERRTEEREASALAAAAAMDDLDPDAIPDKRLELLFVCAHPAIEPAIRTPLMLQAVLGFDAAQIARTFATPRAAMAQRLVRAKKRIKNARIPFLVPDRWAMLERLPPVLEAIYGCYAITGPAGGSAEASPTSPGSAATARADSLAGEAQYLAVTLAALLSSDAEAWALAALITLSLARAPAHGDRFVPLEEQDVRLWDADMIAEGESYLGRAERPGGPGRFQLEAAIQAVHCDRARTGLTDWAALETLYAALLLVAPSLGAQVAHATVVGRADGASVGLSLLDGLADAAADFQPYHAARADLLARSGRTTEAAASYASAIELADDPMVRDYLEEQRNELPSR